MAARKRLTQQSQIARSFGGRSGFVSEELDLGGKPPEEMSRGERSAARMNWVDSGNHYEEYADENRFRLTNLVPSGEMVIAVLIAAFFVGSYLGFIALLALTR